MTGSSVTVNHVTAEAFYLNGTTYVNKDVAGATDTFLMVRNTVNDRGLGVCSPGQVGTAACGLPGSYVGGGGDINELANSISGKPELIRLKVDDGWDWQSVTVSSLDGGEKGKLLWSNSDSLSLATITGAAGVTSFVAGGSTEEPTFAVTGLAAGAKYLYFIPGPDGTDNDDLVWKADVQFVPGPASLFLLAPALARGRGEWLAEPATTPRPLKLVLPPAEVCGYRVVGIHRNGTWAGSRARAAPTVEDGGLVRRGGQRHRGPAAVALRAVAAAVDSGRSTLDGSAAAAGLRDGESE